MLKILVVEDDLALSKGFQYTLKKEGFEVVCAKNIKEAREAFRGSEVNLILLDVMLPDGNGFDFCSEMREQKDIPIIFITACDEEMDVVLGLDLGGDDYIAKPVRVNELISRINAVVRRHYKSRQVNKEAGHRIISGDICVEPLKFKVYKCNSEITLTSLEYKILLLFLENSGNVLPRNVLLDKLWDMEGNFVDANTLNVYIKRIREKLEDNIKEPKYIETVRGIGYRWKEEVVNLDKPV